MLNNVKVSVSQILEAGKNCFTTFHYQKESPFFLGVTLPDASKPEYLHFSSNPVAISSLPKNSGWIVLDKFKSDFEQSHILKEISLVAFCKSIPEAMSFILPLFDPRQNFDLLDFENRSGAWIHKTAQIAPSAKIFPTAIIGAGCQIGAYSEIRPHVTIEPLCRIGDYCIIHSGTVIGSDGFGFYKDPKSQQISKIAQIGNVEIGNHVEIGSNCSIDRATITSTRIGDHTKLDNLVHIAHNSQIGKSSFFAAGFMCAGSVTIGDHFACGGNVVVSDHVTICDHVTIGGNSVVTKDITKSGAYLGFPLQPWKDGLRTLTNLTHITEMRRELTDLTKSIKGV